jgi:hypothetical protein
MHISSHILLVSCCTLGCSLAAAMVPHVLVFESNPSPCLSRVLYCLRMVIKMTSVHIRVLLIPAALRNAHRHVAKQRYPATTTGSRDQHTAALIMQVAGPIRYQLETDAQHVILHAYLPEGLSGK